VFTIFAYDMPILDFPVTNFKTEKSILFRGLSPQGEHSLFLPFLFYEAPLYKLQDTPEPNS
jgi:hypothetical protein